jgi:hypothetical protein
VRREGRPAGIPIGRALDVPAGIAYDDLREAIAAIDRVHGDGDLPRIPVRLIPGVSDFGRFRFDSDSGEPISIAINPNQPHRQFSLLHEIGHFWDWQALGEGRGFGSATSPALNSWRLGILASRAFRALAALNAQGMAVVQREGVPQFLTLTVDQRLAVTRFVRTEEFWARSYAQFMAQRTGEAELLQSLAMVRNRNPNLVYYPIQWDDDDFDPIANTIEVLFHDLGWRT